MIFERVPILLLLGSGCITHVEGTAVSIYVTDSSELAHDGMFVHDRASIGVTNIELLRCDHLTIDPLSEALGFFTPVRIAHAHQGDIRPVATARTTHMEAGAPAQIVDVQSPPAGAYCAMRIELAARSNSSTAVAVEGVLEGEKVVVATSLHVDLEPLFDQPLVLGGENIEASIVLHLRPKEWLADISRETIQRGGIELDRMLVTNVRRTTSVTIQ